MAEKLAFNCAPDTVSCTCACVRGGGGEEGRRRGEEGRRRGEEGRRGVGESASAGGGGCVCMQACSCASLVSPGPLHELL